MKIIRTFIISLAVCAAFNAEAKRIVIKESRGGPNGYRNFSETHGWFGYNHVLICSEPGELLCSWNHPPVIGGYSTEEIMRFIRGEVANGNHSGSTFYNNAVRVTWTFDDNDGLEVIMDDEI